MGVAICFQKGGIEGRCVPYLRAALWTPGRAGGNAGVDFGHDRATFGQRIERPDWKMTAETVEQPHPGKARLGHLGGSDDVINRGRLTASIGVIMRFASAEVHVNGLCAVRLAKIEMTAMMLFKKAGRPQVFILAEVIDIGPERLGGAWYIFARQIGAAFNKRGSKAEIKAEKRGRNPCLRKRPVDHFFARP